MPSLFSVLSSRMKYRDASLSPRAKSVLSMALASAAHFAGYEYARTGALTLVTSERTGYSSSSVVPFAMGCVSPCSLLLLWLYTKVLDRSGPSQAIRYCTIFYAAILCFGGVMMQYIDAILATSNFYREVSRIFLFGLFVLENCFVQLLFTQHWAFMSSVQTKEEAAFWFAPIAGIGSVASTAAAFTVAPLTDHFGLPTLLVLAGATMGLSAFFSVEAYRIATEHGFEPKPKEDEKKIMAKNDGKNLLERAISLFIRVPILGALCLEVLFSQCQSSLMNSLFVLKLKEAIPVDSERARFTGKCYAGVNAFSGLCQFVVLPMLARRLESRHLWLIMPSIIVACSIVMTVQNADNLHTVSGSFLLMKAMEYSVRGVTSEQVYVSLDYESRFLGKEIIGVFVNRLGKSLLAIALSLVTAYFGNQLHLQYLSMSLVLVSTAWLLVSYRLSVFLGAVESTNEQLKTKKE